MDGYVCLKNDQALDDIRTIRTDSPKRILSGWNVLPVDRIFFDFPAFLEIKFFVYMNGRCIRG